jgi:cytoskeletal protein CcmA (bactofilin family)
VDGDIIAPRVAIAEGAHFRGSVDMQRKGGQPAAKESQKSASQPASQQAQAQQQAAAH